jgi:hypothetical protein
VLEGSRECYSSSTPLLAVEDLPGHEKVEHLNKLTTVTNTRELGVRDRTKIFECPSFGIDAKQHTLLHGNGLSRCECALTMLMGYREVFRAQCPKMVASLDYRQMAIDLVKFVGPQLSRLLQFTKMAPTLNLLHSQK